MTSPVDSVPPEGGSRIPMTVLGGYLGAGKTTLVNKILRACADQRIVVIVNDFGEINIDEDLIRSRDADTIGLANGCVCCTLTDGMAAVIDRVRTMDPAPEHVIVEVSGVGDPSAVAVWADSPGYQRNAVIVCADVQTVRDKAQDRWVADTVRAQLRAGDLLVLTKTDLAGRERVADVSAWLAEFAPAVPVVDSAAVEVAELLSPRVPAARNVGARSGGGDHGRYRSRSVATPELVAGDRLAAALDELPDGLVRLKAIVRTTQRPDRRTVVNVVGRQRTISDDGPWPVSDTHSRLVAVATPDLTEAELAELVERLIPATG